ncbi:hypothetical protein OKW96_18925 [Sphingobacterium sp. KU25419]|nr:hypothetical protein OKW96_18925 [Sphingobacterium sp. KU25419]
MKNIKCLGIWMDHSNALLIPLNSSDKIITLTSKFTFDAKEEVLKRSEYIMHNKEEQLNEAFYKEISKEILKQNHVLLFGPTDAKQNCVILYTKVCISRI